VTLPTNPQQLEAYSEREVKAKWMILNAIKDHLISYISKKTTKEMFNALVSLYQSEQKQEDDIV
jgi:hypothetical protein